MGLGCRGASQHRRPAGGAREPGEQERALGSWGAGFVLPGGSSCVGAARTVGGAGYGTPGPRQDSWGRRVLGRDLSPAGAAEGTEEDEALDMVLVSGQHGHHTDCHAGGTGCRGREEFRLGDTLNYRQKDVAGGLNPGEGRGWRGECGPS